MTRGVTGLDGKRRYPFPVPSWPQWRTRALPAGLVEEIARSFPASGLPKLTDGDLIRLEIVIQRFVYSQEWP